MHEPTIVDPNGTRRVVVYPVGSLPRCMGAKLDFWNRIYQPWMYEDEVRNDGNIVTLAAKKKEG